MKVLLVALSTLSAVESVDRLCDETEECVVAGLRAHNSESFDEARRYFLVACKKGDAFGCRAVGGNLRAGLGSERSTLEAIGYFKRACELGDLEACHEVGFTYEFYETPDIEAALSAYATSCSRGYMKSCEAGAARAMGANRSEWAKHMGAVKENCEAGELTSCGTWGVALSRGYGVERDIVQARRFFRKACGKYEPWCSKMWLVPGATATALGLAVAVAASVVLGGVAARRSSRRGVQLFGLVSVFAIILSAVNLYFRTLFGALDTVLWLVAGGLVAVGTVLLLRRFLIRVERLRRISS